MSRVVHLALKVNDLEQSAAFWQKVFGFTRSEVTRKRGHTSCHLTDGRFDLALIQYDSEDTVEAGLAGAGPCIHHFGIAVNDVGSTEGELKRYGCEILSQPGVTPIKFRAPGGVIVEVGTAGVYPGVDIRD
ncbi:MAG: VOC family protein [Pseudomonadota bacterium]